MKLVKDYNGTEIEVSEDTPVKTIDGVHYLLTSEETIQMESVAMDWVGGESSRDIKAQIKALEALQTPRRMREALIDPIWLIDINNQITALRSQLT